MAATVTLLGGTALADVILPTGLNPGDQYEIAFVTADTMTATSGDIDDYNTFVSTEANQDATLGSLGATWHAIAGNPYVNAPAPYEMPIYNTLVTAQK